MRWDNLFDDLEGQLEQELQSEELDLRAEEERLRLGRMAVRDRLVALHGSERRHALYSVRVQLTDGSIVDVRPATIGRDWLSADLVLESTVPTQCILPFSAIGALLFTRSQVLRSVTATAQPETERGLAARLTLSFVLRDLCRRRASVELRLRSSTATGTIDRVGRDHLDLAVHEPSSPRRESAVSGYSVIPFSEILLVRV